MATSIVETQNLTSPGVTPVAGDRVLIIYNDGTSVEKTYVSSEQVIPLTPIRTITVAAFLDRLDLGVGRLASIYKAADQLKAADDYSLFSALENLKRREYLNLDDPRLRIQVESIGFYTTEEVDQIFIDGTPAEEPETV